MSGRTAIVALLSGLGVDDEDIADEVVEYLQTIAEDDDADVESFKECLVGFFEQLGEHAELDSAVQATFDTMRGKVGGTAVAAAPAAPPPQPPPPLSPPAAVPVQAKEQSRKPSGGGTASTPTTTPTVPPPSSPPAEDPLAPLLP